MRARGVTLAELDLESGDGQLAKIQAARRDAVEELEHYEGSRVAIEGLIAIQQGIVAELDRRLFAELDRVISERERVDQSRLDHCPRCGRRILDGDLPTDVLTDSGQRWCVEHYAQQRRDDEHARARARAAASAYLDEGIRR